MTMASRKVICALDTGSIDEAVQAVERLSGHIHAFKVGHGLVLPYGLDLIERLREAGASRIFLDLKFHDIPNSVALAVREAARHKVWMMTLHNTGGPAMLTAAVEEAQCYPETERPILVGVSVLTSIDQHILTDHIGVGRSVSEQVTFLSQRAIECGLDGVVCSPNEVRAVRETIGHDGCIVTPGIRRPDQADGGHARFGLAEQAIADGADYLVIGRGLMSALDPAEALAQYGLGTPVA